MRKIVQLFVVLLIFLTACTPVEQFGQQVSQVQTVVERTDSPAVQIIPYTSRDFGFTLLIPSNWNETEIPNVAVAFVLPAAKGNKPVATLSLEQLPSLLTLEEYTKVVMANLPVRYPDAKILEIADTMFANQSAKQLTYIATIASVPVKVTSTFVTSPDNPVAMSLVYLSPIDSYELHKTDVLRAVASFVFTETESKLEIRPPPAGSAAEAYVAYYKEVDKIRKIEQFNDLVKLTQQYYTKAGFTAKFKELASQEQKTRELLKKVPPDMREDILETLQASREAFFVDYELNPPLFSFIEITEKTGTPTTSSVTIKAKQRFPVGITRTFVVNAKMKKEDGNWKIEEESEWDEIK
ncbi:MAG: hypothetical protein HY363_02345 [Candidatus Aenigmarchaeota archaeon]|nr:hypothetical protein [Candidatus Aenigmarchaeota archaeon]